MRPARVPPLMAVRRAKTSYEGPTILSHVRVTVGFAGRNLRAMLADHLFISKNTHSRPFQDGQKATGRRNGRAAL